MTLREYMDTQEIAIKEIAEKIGVHRNTVMRYLSGERIPETEVMTKIIDATDGRVTANDFFLKKPKRKS